jgi:hypothetical protein
MKKLPLLLLVYIVTALASENHREHDAHMHGHAKMTMALSGNVLELELDTPTMNLLGFEHRATSLDDKKKLKETVDFLSRPSNWMSIDNNTNCNLDSIHVDSSLLVNDDHGYEHSDHADFEIAVKYTCTNAQKLKSINFSGLFNKFQGLEEIDVEWLTDELQSSTELDNSHTIITL